MTKRTWDTEIIPSEILIEDIAELPVSVKNILKRSLYLKTLEDLLNTDYEKIKNARRMGKYYLQELITYVHGLGYYLKGEEDELARILNKKSEEGILIERLIPDPKLYRILYKNQIYTVEELFECGYGIYELENIGPVRRQMLMEALYKVGIEFKPQQTKAVGLSLENAVKDYEATNQLIRERLMKKRQLLEEYQRLIDERKELLKEEQELDDLIQEKQNEIERSSYGKKLSIN